MVFWPNGNVPVSSEADAVIPVAVSWVKPTFAVPKFVLPAKNVTVPEGNGLPPSHGITLQRLNGAPANAGLAMFAVRVTEFPWTTPEIGVKDDVVKAGVMVKLVAGEEVLTLKLLSPSYCAVKACLPAVKPK